VNADQRALIIDWTAFDITDYRFDLAWTLLLTHAHGQPGLRDLLLQSYQHHTGKPVE